MHVSWPAPVGEARAGQHKFEVPDEGTAGKVNLLLDHVKFRLE